MNRIYTKRFKIPNSKSIRQRLAFSRTKQFKNSKPKTLLSFWILLFGFVWNLEFRIWDFIRLGAVLRNQSFP